LLGTFGFIIGEAFLLTYLLGSFAVKNPSGRLLAYALIFISIAFFFAVRWLLQKMGIKIYPR
jgi:hypothetical protein